MSSNRTLILECGDNRVSIASFSLRGPRLCVHQFETQSFAISDNAGSSESWLAKLRVALKSLAGSTKIGGAVVLVIPSHLTLTKSIKIPRVAPAQQEKIIGFEASQNIPYALTEVVWGSVVVGESETELEVMITAAKLEFMQSLWAVVREAGFESHKILSSGCATLAAFRAEKMEERQNFLGVNIGVQSTTLALIESDRFALRTFSLESSEGLSGSTANEPFSAKLLQEITRSSLHFQWKHGLAKPTRLLLSGSGAELEGLPEAINARLKVAVEIANPMGAVDFAAGSIKAKAASNRFALTDLFGAALTQLLPNQPVINLLPPGARQTMNDRRRRPILIASALAAAAVLIQPLIHFRTVRDEAQMRFAAIEQQMVPLRARDFRNQESLRQIEQLKQRLKTTADVGERSGSWLRLMNNLQEQLGQIEDVWFEEMQVIAPKTDAPLKLHISGKMLDRAHPLSKVSPETFTRVKTLLSRLVDLPSIAAVEGERFDHQQPGVLKFDFLLVTDAQRPL